MYKEKILSLISNIAKSDNQYKNEDLDNVSMAMRSFGNYVQRRYAMEYQIPIIRFRYEEEEVRWRVKELDERRQKAHDGAIASVGLLNNLCSMYGSPEIFSGDRSDREQVAAFCEKTVCEFFESHDKIKTLGSEELTNMSRDVNSLTTKELESHILNGTIDSYINSQEENSYEPER